MNPPRNGSRSVRGKRPEEIPETDGFRQVALPPVGGDCTPDRNIRIPGSQAGQPNDSRFGYEELRPVQEGSTASHVPGIRMPTNGLFGKGEQEWVCWPSVHTLLAIVPG